MARVYVTRHGESTWQTTCPISPLARAPSGTICGICTASIGRSEAVDDLVYDARLSSRGTEQAAALGEQMASLGIDLVLTSPCTRAIETALAVQERLPGVPVLVEPLIRERVSDPCDIGRPASVLASEFPALDFGAVPEVWWHMGPKDHRGVAVEPRPECESRASEFRGCLAGFGSQTVLVVSHAGFLRALTGREMANCAPSELED